MNDKRTEKIYRKAYREACRNYSHQKKQSGSKTENPKNHLLTAIMVIVIAVAVIYFGKQLIGLVVGVTVPLIVLFSYILRAAIVIAILVVMIKLIHK